MSQSRRAVKRSLSQHSGDTSGDAYEGEFKRPTLGEFDLSISAVAGSASKNCRSKQTKRPNQSNQPVLQGQDLLSVTGSVNNPGEDEIVRSTSIESIMQEIDSVIE